MFPKSYFPGNYFDQDYFPESGAATPTGGTPPGGGYLFPPEETALVVVRRHQFMPWWLKYRRWR